MSPNNEAAQGENKVPVEPDQSVVDWIKEIQSLRESGRQRGDPDMFCDIDELRNPSRSDNEQFARMYVGQAETIDELRHINTQLTEIVETMTSQFVTCARRMAAIEFAAGIVDSKFTETSQLIEEFGLRQRDDRERHERLLEALLEEKKKTPYGKVFLTVGDVMKLFDFPQGHYAAAKRVMDAAAKNYPDRVKVIRDCEVRKKKVTVVELYK